MDKQLAHSIAEACGIARIGRTTLYDAIGTGDLLAHKCGRRTLVFASDLERWLQSLPPVPVKRSSTKQLDPVASNVAEACRA
jgi:excisionase family DNA binding protein